MTLQEFIPIWQAQPFRAFDLRTAQGVIPVVYPLQVALSPQMKVAVVVDDSRAILLSFDDILGCDPHGPPLELAALISSVPPEKLARNAQLLTTATESTEPAEAPVPPQTNGNAVTGTATTEKSGAILVAGTVNGSDGEPLFSTHGTRWNLHGVQSFDNGTSLYLHHQDHPTVEQRIIIWPPDSGTFEDFSTAKPLSELAQELKRRDQELAEKPAPNFEPKAAFFRSIKFEEEATAPDLRALAFGEGPDATSPDRYELEGISIETAAKHEIRNPRLTDLYRNKVIFDLTETAWDSAKKTSRREWVDGKMGLLLHYEGSLALELRLLIDLNDRTAQVGDDKKSLPLAFVERHLRNFALYEPWDAMMTALRAGPVTLKKPDLVLPIPGGFRVELWAGEKTFPLPFLQPLIVDPIGLALIDFRTTTWTAFIHLEENQPRVTLRLISGERENRYAVAHFELSLDLISHRVTCEGIEGWTTLGMLHALVHRVHGVKWMGEELPTWIAKGKALRVAPIE